MIISIRTLNSDVANRYEREKEEEIKGRGALLYVDLHFFGNGSQD